MTGTGLPRRPYVEAPPPPDGLHSVRVEAAHRRRRRFVRVTAGGATVAAAVAVVAFAAATGDGLAVLRPSPAIPAGPQDPPAATTTPHARVTAPTHGGTAGGSSKRPVGGSAPAVVAPSPGSGDQSPTAMPKGADDANRPAGPQLSRSRSSYAGAPRLCGGSTYGNTSGSLHSGVGWCLDALVTPTAGGERLTITLCRDGSGGGALSYTSSREVDLAVSRDGTRLWSWGRTHPGRPHDHQLVAKANGCWNWSVVWPRETDDGQPAPHGAYVFTATTTATELRGHPTETATFSI